MRFWVRGLGPSFTIALALAACIGDDDIAPGDEASSSGSARADATAPLPDHRDSGADGSLDAGSDATGVEDAGDGGSVPLPPEPVHYSFEVECGAPPPFTFEEQDTALWRLRCAQPVQSVEGLPAGATFDATAQTVTWVPGLDRAGPFAFDLVHTNASRTPIRGMVLDRFDAPGNLPVTDHVAYREEHGLPVIHLTWHSTEPAYCLDAADRDPVPADIVVAGHAHAGAELRCRGATSLTYPKKSFTLRFAKDDPFHAPAGLEQFEGRRRLVLTQTLDDPSQIRTRLAFELHARLDPENVTVDHASAVVFVDGVYQGLYQLTDNVGDHFMAARGLDKDGQMFKSVHHRGDYRSLRANGTPKPDLLFGYEKSDGVPEDDFAPLEQLLRWISETPADTFASTIDDVLRTEDFVDWYVFATAIAASDSYGKNSYVYSDTDGPDERWRYVPWDMNESFGQNWLLAHVPFDAEGRRSARARDANGIWQRMLEIPALAARIDDRYAQALAGAMSRTAVLELVDRLQAEVRPSALRDDRRWDHHRRAFPLFAGRTEPTDFASESTYLRSWVDRRWQLLETLY